MPWKEIDNDVWKVCYGFYPLGTLTDKERQLVRAILWDRRKVNMKPRFLQKTEGVYMATGIFYKKRH